MYCALIGENGKESEFSDLLDARKIFRINEENMDLMTEKFSDIFYGSRGDVQYQTVSLDEEGKYVFVIPKLKDSDINELVVDKVTYNDGSNRFASVPYIENGKLKCTVEKLFGKTDSTIVFKDDTNLTVSLKMEGFTVNGTVAGIFFGLILAGLLGAGFYYVFIKPKHGGITNRGEKSRSSEFLEEQRNEVKEQKAELQANIEELEEQYQELLEGSSIQQYRRNLSALQTTLKEKSCIPQEIIDEMTSKETALLKTIDSKTEMFYQKLQSGKAFSESILSDEQTEQIKDTHKLSEIAEEIRMKNEELQSCLEENTVSDTAETLEDENRKLTAKKNKLQSRIPFDITVIFNGNFNRAFKSDPVTSYIASIDNFRVTGGAVMTVKNFLKKQNRENLNIIFIPSENAEELNILFAGREQITTDGALQQTNRVIMAENSKKKISDGTDELVIVVKKRK